MDTELPPGTPVSRQLDSYQVAVFAGGFQERLVHLDRLLKVAAGAGAFT